MIEKDLIEGLMKMPLPSGFIDSFMIEDILETKETWEILFI